MATTMWWRTTETIYERLGEITTTPLSYIPITVDSDYWQFNPDWKPKRSIYK